MTKTNHSIIPVAEKYSVKEAAGIKIWQRDFDNHCLYLEAMLYDRAAIVFSSGVEDGHDEVRRN
jgi:hypothetical protein